MTTQRSLHQRPQRYEHAAPVLMRTGAWYQVFTTSSDRNRARIELPTPTTWSRNEKQNRYACVDNFDIRCICVATFRWFSAKTKHKKRGCQGIGGQNTLDSIHRCSIFRLIETFDKTVSAKTRPYLPFFLLLFLCPERGCHRQGKTISPPFSD